MSAYINKNYGKGNLWGTHKQEILEIAKTNGVKIENISVEKGVAKFDISVESLLKLHISYLGVQEKVNTVETLTAKLKEDAAFNQFLKGVGEGAWGTLKENWQMVTHPVQTIQDVGEAIKTIANLSADDVQKIYENLKGEAYKFATETELKDASRQVGKVVGGLLIEAALGKGVVKFAKGGLELAKAIKGTKLATEIALKSKQIGSFIGKAPIPTLDVKVVQLINGNKIAVPNVELTKLADIIKPMESRANETLSGVKKAINLPSWNKLTVDIGHIVSGHKADGSRLVNSVRAGKGKDVFPEWMSNKQILNSIKEAYGNARKVKTQTIDGEAIVKLVGESQGMKIEMYVNTTRKTLTTAYPLFGVGK